MTSPHFRSSSDGADDETLAQLERLAESGSRSELAPSSRRENRTEGRTLEAVAEHYRLYNLIELLAAPVRLALAADDSPPQLPEYESLEEIGRGGMGVVYRGLHRKLRRLDAIKVIRPDRLADISPESVRQMQYRFERELRLAAYVAHENIVPVYHVGEVDGRPWFSMQFVEGVSLQEFRANGLLAHDQVAVVMEKIARAVNTVHRHGVLHGDIKPHNILIERETNRPLITDFGLAEFECWNTGVHGT
jgi:serine/threonine protein kinase